MFLNADELRRFWRCVDKRGPDECQRPILGLYVVATDKGRQVSRDMMDGAWHRACAAAGVRDAQFRDIRAMAAKASKDGGQDFQALLGHTTRAMSERYIKGRQTVKAEPVRRKL